MPLILLCLNALHSLPSFGVRNGEPGHLRQIQQLLDHLQHTEVQFVFPFAIFPTNCYVLSHIVSLAGSRDPVTDQSVTKDRIVDTYKIWRERKSAGREQFIAKAYKSSDKINGPVLTLLG